MGSSALLYNANCYFSSVAEEKLIADDLIVQAREATDEDLLVVHTRRYLNKLKVLYLHVFVQQTVQSECQRQWMSCTVVLNQPYRYRTSLLRILKENHGNIGQCTLGRVGGERGSSILNRWLERIYQGNET